jgi:two-component system alkaline phosphatase synthesis response regulator PhoP
VDGFDVCETIRLKNIDSPILMLSARSGSADRVTGLKRGADDYLTKPFNLEELLLRIEKLIEKNRKLQDTSSIGDQYSFGGNAIDFRAQTATNTRGENLSLSKKEVMLLKLLIEYKNEVVSREKILQAVWGYQVFPTTRTIDNFILSFRKYFEPDPREPKHFHSVRGVGYKFNDE